MPNHIQNRLRFIGEAADVQAVLAHIAGKYDDGTPMQIDFNKIVEMPATLSQVHDNATSIIEGEGWGEPISLNGYLKQFRSKLTGSEADKLKQIDKFVTDVRNYLLYGYASFYNWSIANWGTKWNAYQQGDKRDTIDTIHFQTAWSAPVDLIGKLAATFPAVEIEMTYADEDAGSNTGKLRFVNGELAEAIQPKSQSLEGWELFFELHPDERADWVLKDGRYRHVEDDE